MKLVEYARGAVVVAAALAAVPVWAAAPESSTTIIADGTTEPSDRIDRKPELLGLVKDVPVKEGDVVKQGDVLIQQDDRIEKKTLEALEIDANSLDKVEAAVADEKQKKIKLERVEKIAATDAGSASELEEAELAHLFAVKQIALAEQEMNKAKVEAERQKLRIEQMKIQSPFDGIVERVEASRGEVVDPDDVAITLVQINPLKVVTTPPAEVAARLKKGDKVQVRYRVDGPAAEWQEAEVTYLAPVARADANSKRAVHLKLPNPSGREAGLWVDVKLPVNPNPSGVERTTAAGGDGTAR
jgi:RND family efflux transporter MFP subunit